MTTMSFRLLATTVALVAVAADARGAPGDMDPRFGVGGIVTTAVGPFGTACAVVLQRDKKIVAAGYVRSAGDDVAVARYHDDGMLDTSFGTGGKVVTSVFYNDRAYAAVVQDDGRIVVGGTTFDGRLTYFLLIRYNLDGTLDTTFDGDGIAITSVGAIDNGAFAALLQNDRKIVAVGEAYEGTFSGSTGIDFGLARYTPSGALDPTFGTGGVVRTDLGTSVDDRARAALLQPDGKIVVVGYSFRPGNADFALARYDTRGVLDSTFGQGGVVRTPVGAWGGGDTYHYRAAALLQSDGKIVVVGHSANAQGEVAFTLARYLPNGPLDPTFGVNGIAKTRLTYGNYARAAVLQPDGKIVAVGEDLSRFTLVRYNPDGTVDPTFGTGGVVSGLPGGPANAAVHQPVDCKVVAAGAWGGDFALARYDLGCPSPCSPIPFLGKECDLPFPKEFCPPTRCRFLPVLPAEARLCLDDPAKCRPFPVCRLRCSWIDCCGSFGPPYLDPLRPGIFVASVAGGSVRRAEGVRIRRARSTEWVRLEKSDIVREGDWLAIPPKARLEIKAEGEGIHTPRGGLPEAGFAGDPWLLLVAGREPESSPAETRIPRQPGM